MACYVCMSRSCEHVIQRMTLRSQIFFLLRPEQVKLLLLKRSEKRHVLWSSNCFLNIYFSVPLHLYFCDALILTN